MAGPVFPLRELSSFKFKKHRFSPLKILLKPRDFVAKHYINHIYENCFFVCFFLFFCFFEIYEFLDYFYIFVLKQEFQKNGLCKSKIALG